MNGGDCGCDGGSTNVDILNRNLGTSQVMNNQVRYVNNIQQNQQAINSNQAMNQMIAPVQGSSEVNQLNNAIKEASKKEEKDQKLNKKEIKLFLLVLLALAVNEMCKFFINQSIRLNKASSNRYIFYPLGVVVLLALVCLC